MNRKEENYNVVENMNDMFLTISRLDELSQNQIEVFAEILVSGGQVATEYIDKGIRRADFLAFCKIDEEIVGIASIKNPTNSYKYRVFKKAHAEEFLDKYNFEIGYAVTKEGHRGKGISSSLVKTLMENSESKSFFATTKSEAMKSILTKLGMITAMINKIFCHYTHMNLNERK